LKSIDYTSLPRVHILFHHSILQLDFHSHEAERLKPGLLAGGFDSFEGGGVLSLEGENGWRNSEVIGRKRGPKEAGEDFGMDLGSGGSLQLASALNEGVGAAGLDHVFEHDFAGLERGVSEANLEEFENAGLKEEFQLASEYVNKGN
jgi:hypothetical protein